MTSQQILKQTGDLRSRSHCIQHDKDEWHACQLTSVNSSKDIPIEQFLEDNRLTVDGYKIAHKSTESRLLVAMRKIIFFSWMKMEINYVSSCNNKLL